VAIRVPDTHETARALLETVMVVMRSVAAEMRRSRQPLEPGHMGALMRLAAGPCTMTELARHLNVKPPTMSKSIDLLVRRGWVARTAGIDDRRRTLVALTPAGRRVLIRVEAHAAEHVAEALAPMPALKRAALVNALDAVKDALGR
jgi:DNA-binding MarR family transcriptional regulator